MSQDLGSNQFANRSRLVLLGGFTGSVISVGLTIYLFGVFQDSILATFQASVSAYSWGPPLFTAASGILSPIIGRSLATSSRAGLSIRTVMLTGALCVGVGLVGVSRASSLSIAGLIFGLIVAPGAILMGPMLGQAMVTNWFDATRGRALGIVSAGTTVGGMLLPTLAAVLIKSVGWRDALGALGALSLLFSIPVILLCVRDRPSDLGLTREQPAEGKEVASTEIEPSDTRELLRQPKLWLVGTTFGLIFSAGTVSTVFMVPYATQLGLPLLGGAAIASARSGFAAVGKIVFGSLADRLGVRRVLFGVVVVEIVLTAILIVTRDPIAFAVLGVAIGFVGGAPLPLKAEMAATLFGRADFASSMGLLASIAVPFQLFMVPIAGAIYVATETYAAVFGLTIPCFALGVVFLLLLPKGDSE